MPDLLSTLIYLLTDDRIGNASLIELLYLGCAALSIWRYIRSIEKVRSLLAAIPEAISKRLLSKAEAVENRLLGGELIVDEFVRIAVQLFLSLFGLVSVRNPPPLTFVGRTNNVVLGIVFIGIQGLLLWHSFYKAGRRGQLQKLIRARLESERRALMEAEGGGSNT